MNMKKMASTVFSISFSDWSADVATLLEEAHLGKLCQEQEKILIKPNLVEILPPPITTPVRLIEAVVDYLLEYIPSERILIGEGCGATHHDTHRAFKELGYTELSRSKSIQLMDLNVEKLCRRSNTEYQRWPEIYLPCILDESFLLSVPQLKAHSLSTVTLTMKNMMGCAPPQHYKGSGSWNKAAFHTDIHNAIYDLNRYRTPDFTLLDATIGMAQAHLWGPECDPPVAKLAASFDPVAIDSYGASLLGRDWHSVGHIAAAHTVLGNAESYDLKNLRKIQKASEKAM